MDRERKRQLLEQYKTRKTEMGVLQIKNKSNGKSFYMASIDIPSDINSLKFQLDLGSYPIFTLQREWKAMGGEKVFEISVRERLEHKENDEGVSYKKELETLKEMAIAEDGGEIY